MFNRKLYERGRMAEYKVIKFLQKKGFMCMRAPASGKAAKNVDYPDVVCVMPKKCITLAIEVKYTNKLEVRYINKKQYETLKKWAEAGAISLVVIVLTGGYMAAVKLEDLLPHDDEEHPAKVDKATIASAPTLEKFVSELLGE